MQVQYSTVLGFGSIRSPAITARNLNPEDASTVTEKLMAGPRSIVAAGSFSLLSTCIRGAGPIGDKHRRRGF